MSDSDEDFMSDSNEGFMSDNLKWEQYPLNYFQVDTGFVRFGVSWRQAEYAVHLMEIFLNAEELEERQMAGTLLKRYVYTRWTQHDSVFDLPIASSVVKTQIRTMLPKGLSDAISEIRNCTASILVQIASTDFPNDWPDMLQAIVVRLHNADSDTCSGILEFIKELDGGYEFDYPFLYEIAQNTVRYSTKIRADAIYLFGNISTLCPIESKERLDRYRLFSEFCYMCKRQLMLPHPDETDYYLKGAIIKCYIMLVSQAKENLRTTITKILPTIWQILFHCGQMFDEMLAHETFPNRDLSETPEEGPLFYTFLYNILELLCVLLDAQLARKEILMVRSDLLYNLVLFMGIPKDIEDRWKSDENVYLGEEFNDESYNTSVRIKARDLLLVMTRELPAGSLLNAFAVAISKHRDLYKMKSASYYWRVMEAVMFAIGSIKTFILNRYGTYEFQHFDIHGYLSEWIKEMDRRPTWFMAARIMWVGGCYALILEKNILSSYLMYTICNIQKPSNILRYSAIRAVSLHFGAITKSKHCAIYMEARGVIIGQLMCTIDHLEGYVLHLALFTLQLLLNIPPLYIETVQHPVITLITNVIKRNITRPEFITDCLPIVKSLTVSVPCRQALETNFLPFITNAINEPDPSVYLDFALLYKVESSIIDILNVIVKYSPEPLSDNIFSYSFAPVYASILIFDDPRIIQNGTHFLRRCLCKGAAQIASYTGNNGRTGTDYILDVLKHVLDPNKMELSWKQVGHFFITALRMLRPQLQPHTDFLLQAVFHSLQRANTRRVEESLLIIFTYLFHNHFEPALNYLTSVRGPEGQNALVFILDKWLSKNYNFGGKCWGNLNVLAITRLIKHTILQQDQRVADIKLVDAGSSIPLAASEFETDLDSVKIPVVVKLIKHLINVLQREIQLAEDGRPVIGVGSSEISVTSTRPGSSRNPDSFAAIYEQYKQQIEMDSTTDSTDDSNCCDPRDATYLMYNMKITEFLTIFFQNFAENAIFMEYLQYLPNCDKKALLNIGVCIIKVEDLEGDE